MNRFIKGALKVFTDYCITTLVFVIFIYVFMGITQDRFNTWLPLYCFVNFGLLLLMLYSDMKTMAIKEKRPQYNLNPRPFDGLVYGLMGILPLFLLEILYLVPVLNTGIAVRLKELALNTLLGPVYGFVRMGQESPLSYVLAVLVVAVVAMLGYLAGFYGIETSRYLGRFYQPKRQEKKGQKR